MFVPCLYPGSHADPDDGIKLGRKTDYRGGDGVPTRGIGLREFLVGEDVKAVLELGKIGVQGDGVVSKVGLRLQRCHAKFFSIADPTSLALLGVELRGVHVVPPDRRRRTARGSPPPRRSRTGRSGPGSSCGRSTPPGPAAGRRTAGSPGCVSRSVFQPMCGTFSPGRAGKRTTSPGNRSSPACRPSSWLRVNSICRPRQMPRNGRPA